MSVEKVSIQSGVISNFEGLRRMLRTGQAETGRCCSICHSSSKFATVRAKLSRQVQQPPASSSTPSLSLQRHRPEFLALQGLAAPKLWALL